MISKGDLLYINLGDRELPSEYNKVFKGCYLKDKTKLIVIELKNNDEIICAAQRKLNGKFQAVIDTNKEKLLFECRVFFVISSDYVAKDESEFILKKDESITKILNNQREYDKYLKKEEYIKKCRIRAKRKKKAEKREKEKRERLENALINRYGIKDKKRSSNDEVICNNPIPYQGGRFSHK